MTWPQIFAGLIGFGIAYGTGFWRGLDRGQRETLEALKEYAGKGNG